jgi:hypothetical protein
MTPQGQPMQPPAGQQPSWFSKNWKWLLGGVLALALLCCGGSLLATVLFGAAVAQDPEVQKAWNEGVKEMEKEAGRQQREGGGARDDQPLVRVVETDQVRVDCGEPGPGGVDCTMKRTAGSKSAEVCWDLEITCQNGGVMSGHTCGKLATEEQEGVVNMAADTFSDQDACDVPANGQVKNLQVTTN